MENVEIEGVKIGILKNFVKVLFCVVKIKKYCIYRLKKQHMQYSFLALFWI